jgi:purine-nucleoside phosphorylase
MAISADRIIAIIAVAVAVASLCCCIYHTQSNDSDEEVDEYERISHCVKQIREYTDMVPEVAIVLGSGLSTVVDRVDVEAVIPYSKIDGFPVSTVEGHKGNYVFGKIGGTDVVIMQGRVHYYEGYSTQDVVLPIRVMHELGADTIIITNAAGSLNYDFEPGTFMLITDHICAVDSPLIGPNIDELGDRFVGMMNVYDPALTQEIEDVAADFGIEMGEGVYVQYAGPQFETAAETKMFRLWGADAVGMSTVIEAIAAQHMGMRIAGISCITDMATGMSDVSPSHEEVEKMAKKMSSQLAQIIDELLSRYNLSEL